MFIYIRKIFNLAHFKSKGCLIGVHIINQYGLRSALILLTAQIAFPQAPKITSIHLNSYNITPQTLCTGMVMNPSQEIMVYMETSLQNDYGIVLKARTGKFIIKQGMNVLSALDFSIISSEWGNSKKAEYIKNTRQLLSGRYQHCLKLFPVNSDVLEPDEECEEVESVFSSNLFLIHPSDKDTINESRPLLAWGLSDPMGLNTPEENNYRIILAELHSDQNAESGLLVNNPIFIKDNLKSFQIQYPMDGEGLETGKRYAWRIQLLGRNGTVENQTEAWEFVIKQDKKLKSNKYALLNKTVSSDYYTTEDNHIYFCFNKEYSAGELNCFIYNSKMEMIIPKLRNAWNPKKGISVTGSGYNQFDINLNELEISRGFHTLEVKNEKGEWGYLRVLVL
ncbi:MAG: hypothetical protein A3H98_10640 [Bacteroidetes bacterium RIFCSPLOWO2_02_FULL_36_8]|nr:MAG: hypothetical protein A3H98_10640 [Bacteroidetes bacterium RIFCSPLOWO2_02_FULL_36_8]OFY69756.1 MAG: hypothetical protein A3G23_11425 [Bacteroidetes bacterium RIFCSPLOWO2_12_FULL_37_12]